MNSWQKVVRMQPEHGVCLVSFLALLRYRLHSHTVLLNCRWVLRLWGPFVVPGVELCIHTIASPKQTPNQRGFNTTNDSFSWKLLATCWWGFKLYFGILSLFKVEYWIFFPSIKKGPWRRTKPGFCCRGQHSLILWHRLGLVLRSLRH